MATNLTISENQERVPLSVGTRTVLRSVTPDDGSPYYVGARAYVTQNEDGATVTVIDKEGTTTADIFNGQDGADGQDGFSPTATVTKSGDTATITITDKDGTTTAEVYDGSSGGASAFVAEFGTTTYADVKDAYDNDAIIICTADDSGNTKIFQLAYFDDGNSIFYFAEPTGDGWDIASVSENDGWDNGTIQFASTDVATQLRDGLMSALDKQKLDGIASGAEVNVQSDWNQSVNTADDYIKNKPTIPSKTSDLANDSLYARGHIASFHGTCTTGAATAAKAVTCADFKATDLVAGAIIVVSFSETNSAAVADLTLNVNSTGAYHIKRNSAGTIGNLDAVGNLKASSSYMFYFDGSYWVIAAYYNDTNTNTIGYTIRTNGLQLPVKTQMYRYRICFTSADGEYFVPANASTSTSATASKTVTTEKIDPFGRIVYYNTTAAVAVNSYPTASSLCQQYNGIYLGYSFNRTGAALTLTNHKPVYIKCAPQTDGSAIIDADNPFVQTLPSTEDGKLYIFLGIATAATTIEMTLEHPVYCYKDGCVRQWTNAYVSGGGGTITDVEVDGTSVVTGGVAEIDLTGKSDVGHTHTKSAITDFPTLAAVATTGNYNSLTDKPTIPTVNDATLTIQKNSTNVATFTANASSNVTANITVPTDTGDLTNGAGYITGGTPIPTADSVAEFDGDAHMNSTDMTSQEVSDFVDSLDAQGANLADYVVEQGTSGIWTYRKWNSGIAECWGSVTKNNHHIDRAWGSWYVSASGTANEFYANYPSGLFVEAPNEMVNVNSYGSAIPLMAGTEGTTKDHTGHYALARGTASIDYNAIFAFYSIGRWK